MVETAQMFPLKGVNSLPLKIVRATFSNVRCLDVSRVNFHVLRRVLVYMYMSKYTSYIYTEITKYTSSMMYMCDLRKHISRSTCVSFIAQAHYMI